MLGVMLAWSAWASASSARPVRTAEPRRSMSSDDGGEGTISSGSRRRESTLFERVLVFGSAVFLRPEADGVDEALVRVVSGRVFAMLAFFDAVRLVDAVRLADARRAEGFVVFFFFFKDAVDDAAFFFALAAGFLALLLAALEEVLPLVLEVLLALVRAAALPAGLDFFRDEAAFDVLLALRLAMMQSFRNLDSVAISVVLSDAYRKSDGGCRAPADRNCGPPDPATRTPALVRVSHGFPGPVVRRQEECARHGKR
jgi:hypothetical protein